MKLLHQQMVLKVDVIGDMDNNSIRVLFVAHSTGFGGASRSMLQLMIELRNNYNVTPIVLMPYSFNQNDKYSMKFMCNQNSIEVIETFVPWFKRSSFVKFCILYLLHSLYLPVTMWKLRHYKFDLIHSNGSVQSLGGLLSRLFKIPHVWHLREFGFLDFGFKDYIGKWHERMIYKRGDVFIAISKIIKNAYTDVIPAEKIKVIYNGISVTDYNKQAHHTNTKIQFVCVGAVHESKNQLDVIKATKLLVDSGVTDFMINIVGPESKDYKEQLDTYIKENEISDFITFHGIRNDVPNFLEGMDIGLMLSNNEAFGRVTVEYMLQNLAVIASNTGANPEIISNNEIGLLYKHGEPEDLAQCMKQLIEDNNLLKSMSTAGQLYAREMFPSSKNTRLIYDIYKSVLAPL